eukprot:TRINITY_DN3183_c0_g1_i1.p1 TRINITY_DN3183_c0_g1~~TRINITY_DN3183_c0_g1_i1.p1  ORF type:complete len:316 (+),score=93.52 TRINITY_DN3183_c0_g1_i1:173-1120(+)
MEARNTTVVAMAAAAAACVGATMAGASQSSSTSFLATPSVQRPTALASGAALRAGSSSVAAASPSAAASPFSVQSACAVAAALCVAQAGQRRLQQRRSRAARQATRIEWYRKVRRMPGDAAVFDVVVKKPLGVKMELYPQNSKLKGVGISEVVEGGNTDLLNQRVCKDDGEGMWVLEGDKVMAVNDVDVEEGTIEDIVKEVQAAKDEVKLTLQRNTRTGPVKIVVNGPVGEGRMITVRRGSRLSAAAEYCAGRELTYGCIDGWCGTCWHRERTTNGVFKPCCDVITGDWDNVMPLVLSPKPEKAGDGNLYQPRGM